jgi:CO dehydrogenase maturation factor
MGLKIAIGGKGGVGKTTICAVWAQLFTEDGLEVLAIDADSNTSLASAFGIPCEKRPQPIINMKQLIAERTGAGKDSIGAYFRLNPKVSDLPDKYLLEVDAAGRLKLLVLGGITQAGAGCACPEAAFLKALLTYTILQRQEVVLVDLAAGVEFMGRASVEGIDVMVIVVEPGGRSIETAVNIAKMAKQLGIKQLAAVINKITTDDQLEIIRAKLKGITVLGAIKYTPAVQQADLQQGSVLKASAEFVEQLRKAKNALTDFYCHGDEL